jgi:hypothetical protein
MMLIWLGELKAISEMRECSTRTSTFTALDLQVTRVSSFKYRFSCGLLEASMSIWTFLRFFERLDNVFDSNKVLKVPLADKAAILFEIVSSSAKSWITERYYR